jgi:uncharacterized repeat protein (TIGR01451 family)
LSHAYKILHKLLIINFLKLFNFDKSFFLYFPLLEERATFDESSKTRIMKRNLFAFILFWLITGSLTGQENYWEAGVGPYGGSATIIPTDSNVVYARHFLGLLFRSADYGQHWTQLSTTLPDSNVYAEGFYIGRSGYFYSITSRKEGNTWIKSLHRSGDEGATWEILSDQIGVTGVWESPSGALIGYDETGGLHRSADGGVTWQLIVHTDFTFAYNDTGILFGDDHKILIVHYNGPIVYSLDDGQSWAVTENEIFNFSNRLKMMPNGTLFRYSNVEVQMFRSTDWGEQWIPINLNFDNDEYWNTVIATSGARLLLATSKHIYFSDDDGISWNVLSNVTQKPTNFILNDALPNGDILSFYKSGLYRSSDEGATWTFSAYGMRMATTYQMEFLSDSLQLGVTSDGLWRSADAGSTWTRLLPDTSSLYYYYNIVYPQRPLAVSNADSFVVAMRAEAWRTTNGGGDFQNITPPHKLATEHIFSVHGGRLITTDSVGMLRSDDFGLSWQGILPGKAAMRLVQNNTGIMLAIVLPIAEVYNINSQDTLHSQLYRSDDNGENWENINIPGIPSNALIWDLARPNQEEFNVTAELPGGKYVIASSSDMGATWMIQMLPDILTGSSVALNSLDHIFTTSTGHQYGVFSSVDQGQSWFHLPPLLESGTVISDLKVSPSGQLYVLTNFVSRTTQSNQNGGYLRGQVLRDADADCSTPDAQEPIKNWVVEVSGEQDFVVSTSQSGNYAVFMNPGTYEVHARVPQNNWWNLCDSLLTVQIDSAQTTDSVNFAAISISECPLMAVDVSIPLLRRCFDNTVYISYCNISSELADSAWVDVELDPYLNLANAPLPYEPLGNNTYRFQLGDVDWGDCGQFTFVVHVDCDSTAISQTHCITAHGFPDTLCNPVPNWSGATIEASASCQDSVVHLHLQNISTTPSATLNYIIIEDDVVLFDGQKQYDGNETFNLEYPANGHTWRIESQQEPGHPFSNVALAFLEGCGGFQTLGYINQFSVNGWTPSIDRACLENSGSFDPNDKHGFPTGYGDNHRIRPGQALEYMIRFQNTGTDTAFTVQIRDTLSAWLDPATIRPGASSHPYTWNLSGPGVLTFRFDNIMLPDSNVNLTGSQGFVSFRIDQKPEVPLETQILNTAAIYFDFNAPVITNQTLHTVGVDYITATKDFEKPNVPAIAVQPNPAEKETLVSLPPGTERLMVFDALGRALRVLQVRGATVRLERGNLPAGVYGLRAEDKHGNLTGAGKIIWK